MYRLLFLLLSLLLSSTSLAATRFTYISPESEKDPRMTYDRELLLSLIHISEPTRRYHTSRMPSSA